jgi:catechol 2,3-dioxygenase-like lactoylglutathione lyase family enzyme
MADENPSIMHHISIGTNDFDRATAFYDQVMAAIGAKRVFEFPGAVAYGQEFPELWVQTPIDGATASCGNGSHFAFIAPSRDAVQAFYDAALAAGGTSDGEPGPRPDYGTDYFGCFIRDPDGHKIEAAVVPDTMH